MEPLNNREDSTEPRLLEELVTLKGEDLLLGLGWAIYNNRNIFEDLESNDGISDALTAYPAMQRFYDEIKDLSHATEMFELDPKALQPFRLGIAITLMAFKSAGERQFVERVDLKLPPDIE